MTKVPLLVPLLLRLKTSFSLLKSLANNSWKIALFLGNHVARITTVPFGNQYINILLCKLVSLCLDTINQYYRTYW